MDADTAPDGGAEDRTRGWTGANDTAAPPPPPPPPPPLYPPPPYAPAPGYGPPGAGGAGGPADGVAVAALVLGIVAVPLFWALGLVPVAALIVGGIALGRTAGGRRNGRGMAIAGTVLGAVGLVAFVVWAVVVTISDSDDPPARPSADPAPTEDTIEIPRPTSTASIDRVFAPIPGYVMTEAPVSEVADIRDRIESEPAAKAVMVDVGGRDVRQNGRSIARAYAITFDGRFAESPEAGEAFIDGAAEQLLTRQDITIGGQKGVSGTDSEGNAVIILYKDTVGLVVGGPNMFILEQFAAKLLANVAQVS